MNGSQKVTYERSVTANIGWYVVSEKWHHFWELPQANLLGLVEVAGKNTIFPILSKYRYLLVGQGHYAL